MPLQSRKRVPPASFLTLPRELRQKILLLSLEEASKDDIKFNILLRRLSDIMPNFYCTSPRPRSPISAPHIMKWASVLHSVDSLVCEDLPLVIEQCLCRFESMAAGIGPVRVPNMRWMRIVWFVNLPDRHVDRDASEEGLKKIRIAIGLKA